MSFRWIRNRRFPQTLLTFLRFQVVEFSRSLGFVTNVCYSSTGSFSSRGPFQRARGLFGLICLLACSSSCRAARKDFTLSLRKKQKDENWCDCAQQILKLSSDPPHPSSNKQQRTFLHKNSWHYKLPGDWAKLAFKTIQTSCLAT